MMRAGGDDATSASASVAFVDEASQSESFAGTDMQREDATSMSDSVVERVEQSESAASEAKQNVV